MVFHIEPDAESSVKSAASFNGNAIALRTISVVWNLGLALALGESNSPHFSSHSLSLLPSSTGFNTDKKGFQSSPKCSYLFESLAVCSKDDEYSRNEAYRLDNILCLDCLG